MARTRVCRRQISSGRRPVNMARIHHPFFRSLKYFFTWSVHSKSIHGRPSVQRDRGDTTKWRCRGKVMLRRKSHCGQTPYSRSSKTKVAHQPSRSEKQEMDAHVLQKDGSSEIFEKIVFLYGSKGNRKTQKNDSSSFYSNLVFFCRTSRHTDGCCQKLRIRVGKPK